MTKLHSHLKKGLISILSLTLILSNISAYAIDDTTNIIIEEDNLDESDTTNIIENDYEGNNSNIVIGENDLVEDTSNTIATNNLEDNIVLSQNEEDIIVDVSTTPNMDIVLTQTDMDINLSSFEKDLIAQLQSLGVQDTNTDIIRISSVETQTADLQNSFTWKQDLSSSIGSITTTSNSVIMKGNTSKVGSNAVYCMPTLNGNIYDFEFDYNISFGDSFNAAGMLLNVEENGNYLDGYMISFNNRNTFKTVSGTTAALWKVRWEKGTNTSNIICKSTSGLTNNPGANQAYLIKTLSINTSGTLKVKAEDDQITISGGGLSETAIPIDKSWGGNGFGFFSDHYSHNCSNIGSFNLTNISMNVTTIKEYTDVLSEPSWREDAYHFIVNVDNTTSIFDNSNTRANTLSRTMNDDIHFIDWGTTSTKTKVSQFVTDNDNKGIFTLSNDYNQAIIDTANYIYSQIDNNSSSEYVVVGENTNLTVIPVSLKTNTIDDNYPNGKWYIKHDYTYFDNNLGLSSQTENYKSDLICSFDKPGKYDIYFADKLVKTIYAHRKPISSFTIGLNGTSVSLISDSYDLDSNNNSLGLGNGIAKENWSYIKMGDTSWTNGKLTSFDRNNVYIIKLEVEDFQGATSYTTKYIGTGDPVASFSLGESVISKYSKLSISDTSYDPEGYPITKWNWILKKNGTQVATYTTQIPNTDFNSTSLGVGTYQYVLTVTNSNGITSDTFTKTFSVIEDSTSPEILVSPTNCDWKTGTQSIEVNVSDSDSGLNNWQYSFTNSQTTPTSGWSTAQTTGNATISTPLTTGEYYLHIKATDNAGNVLDRALGLYKIDNNAPVINLVSSADDCTYITVDATDNGSGIVGYAITTSNTTPEKTEFQASNELKTYKSGKFYVWTIDKVGQISKSKEVTVNRKQTATINWHDNDNSENLRPTKVTLTLYRDDSKFKEVEIDSSTTSYTFDNLDSMNTNGKTYSYTFGLDVNERYDIQIDGDNISATMKESSFSVTIPKYISLNGDNGKATYSIGTKGTLFLNDTINVKPDTSFNLNDSVGLQTLKVNVSQSTTSFDKLNLGTSSGTLQTSKEKFAGVWNGTFNFVIKFTKKN